MNEHPLAEGPISAVPDALRNDLAPARWIVHEWRDYWLRAPDATQVYVGTREVTATPSGSGHYLVRFENQLGLASIRIHDAEGRPREPLHVEVVASKFKHTHDSVTFLKGTLAALYAKVTSTPFVLGALTDRQVRESRTPPTPLFTFHFFRHHWQVVQRAVQAVLGRVHQRLSVEGELVRPHQVRQIDREALLRMVQTGHPVPAPAGVKMTPLQRLRPERVWQQIPVETFDTPENRFVLDVARQMLTAARTLQRAEWWKKLDVPDQRPVISAIEHLSMLTTDPRLASLGPLVTPPVQSRVLQRKDGYRDLALLWQQFQRSREPLFAHMEQAIALRNVADLYELWVLFELIDQIATLTEQKPVLSPVVDPFGVPRWQYTATFGNVGQLVYNQTKRSYSSNALRPDYLWWPEDGTPGVALDAKFRLSHKRKASKTATDEDTILMTDAGETTTSGAMLTMHAYRDAISNLRAAVILYPGQTTEFWETSQTRRHLTLREVLFDDWSGVGEIALTPHGVTALEDQGDEDE